LSSDLTLDPDANGEADDVDSDATNANLEWAITNWAKDADSLIVYLTDHGGNGVFQMSDTEITSAEQVDNWIDTLQEESSCKVIFINDSSQSGSFIPLLIAPEGKERIVIASTLPDEVAYVASQSAVSFSTYFWSQILNGFDIGNAFELSSDAVKYLQNPIMDANSNGIGNEAEDLALARNIYIIDKQGFRPDFSANNKREAIIVAGGRSIYRKQHMGSHFEMYRPFLSCPEIPGF
jgi:hypothetical protein